MKPADEKLARSILRAVAKAVKQRFAPRLDHEALAELVAELESRVAALERQIAELNRQPEEAA